MNGTYNESHKYSRNNKIHKKREKILIQINKFINVILCFLIISVYMVVREYQALFYYYF